MSFKDRYKLFCDVLMGKHIMDQMMIAFDGKSDENLKYSNVYIENEKFWILNVCKTIYKERSSWMIEGPKIIDKSFFYSLYMHKEKDLLIIKLPVFSSGYQAININNNIKTYFGYNLKKMGFYKYEFTNEKKGFNNFGNKPLKQETIKILIPNEKNEDDFVKLLICSEKINTFIIDNDFEIWDNMVSVNEKVKIDF